MTVYSGAGRHLTTWQALAGGGRGLADRSASRQVGAPRQTDLSPAAERLPSSGTPVDAQTMTRRAAAQPGAPSGGSIRLLQESERLAKAVYVGGRLPCSPLTRWCGRRVMFSIAIRSALLRTSGAFVIILSGCLIRIGSAWPDGGTGGLGSSGLLACSLFRRAGGRIW